MAIPQQKFRELVLQLLYSYDLSKVRNDEMVELMMKELSVTKKVVYEALERVEKVIALKKTTDKMIREASYSYDFDRIQTVERNILRLGVFELFHDEAIPPKVAIAEAMRLARKFSTPEASTFVNAILDQLYQKSLGTVPDTKVIEQVSEAMKESEDVAAEAAQAAKEESSDDESQQE